MFARAVVRRFPVLGYRDFRLLLADRLLAPMAFAFSLVGVSFAVLDATGSTADLSYVLAAQIAPSLVFTLVGGVIADRVPPQWVIIAGNVMIALGEGTFGVLVLTGPPAAVADDRCSRRSPAPAWRSSTRRRRRCCPGWCPAICCRRPARSAVSR